MRTGLSPDDLGDLLDQPLIAILATRRPDDTTLLSPVWFEWRDGGFSVWVPSPKNAKVRDIARDPRVSIVVASQGWPYRGIEVRGDARLSSDGFDELVGRTAERYMGAGAAERMVGTMPEGVVVRIEPGVLRAWDYEDEV
jgi:PPOX class probable F420-dependent enzyme